MVLPDGSVCTVVNPETTLGELSVGNHTLRIRDPRVEDPFKMAIRELKKMVGPNNVSSCVGVDRRSRDPIIIYPGPNTGSRFQSFVKGVKAAARTIHDDGPPVEVKVSTHQYYTCITWKCAARARYCVLGQPEPDHGDRDPVGHPVGDCKVTYLARRGPSTDTVYDAAAFKSSKGTYVVVENGNLEAAIKAAHRWMVRAMCLVVGAKDLPLIRSLFVPGSEHRGPSLIDPKRGPDFFGVTWVKPGDTVTFLETEGETTCTIKGSSRVAAVAIDFWVDRRSQASTTSGRADKAPAYDAVTEADKALELAEDRLARARAARDDAAGKGDTEALTAAVVDAEQKKEAAREAAREAAGIKKRPADDDAARRGGKRPRE